MKTKPMPTKDDVRRLSAPIDAAPPRPRVAFMTQTMATKLVEGMEAGRGSPWLSGLEIRPVELGTRIVSADGRTTGVIRDHGSIALGTSETKVVPPEPAP